MEIARYKVEREGVLKSLMLFLPGNPVIDFTTPRPVKEGDTLILNLERVLLPGPEAKSEKSKTKLEPAKESKGADKEG